ncbi:hypothetical protein BXZ70DRAFT_957222 [Cristinia sonorae]|uniref:Uncharacterized protein n=1 Tax=Cristinia sonorae TaxID=1940300 RepID=A0A8K0UFL8_9AGAR|nr:hypothetical protein BXZ70DRAFT_957222 [Cristinia sonorae]
MSLNLNRHLARQMKNFLSSGSGWTYVTDSRTWGMGIDCALVEVSWSDWGSLTCPPTTLISTSLLDMPGFIISMDLIQARTLRPPPLPSELWHKIARDSTRSLRQLTLVNHLLRDIAQSLLFASFSMHILREYNHDSTKVLACYHDSTYGPYLHSRLDFYTSPRIAPFVKSILIGHAYPDHQRFTGGTPTNAIILIRAVFERAPSFKNLQRIQCDSCPIDTECIRHMYTIPTVIHLTIDSCMATVDLALLGRPIFHLKRLKLKIGRADTSEYASGWWLALIAFETEHVTLQEEATSALFLSAFAATPPTSQTSLLRHLHLHTIAPENEYFLAVLSRLPNLEKLVVEEGTVNFNQRAAPTSIPSNLLPSLRAISCPWMYGKVFLRHRTIREAQLGILDNNETPLIHVTEIRSIRPELTVLEFSLQFPGILDIHLIEFVLTQFSHLERLSVSANVVDDDVIDQACRRMLTLELVPTLQWIDFRAISLYPAFGFRSGPINAQLAERLHLQSPALTFLRFSNRYRNLYWKRG